MLHRVCLVFVWSYFACDIASFWLEGGRLVLLVSPARGQSSQLRYSQIPQILPREYITFSVTRKGGELWWSISNKLRTMVESKSLFCSYAQAQGVPRDLKPGLGWLWIPVVNLTWHKQCNMDSTFKSVIATQVWRDRRQTSSRRLGLSTGLGWKALARFGESYHCSCLPLLTCLACSIHAT